MKAFLKELAVAVAISGLVGLGAGVAVCACIEHAFDRVVDSGMLDIDAVVDSSDDAGAYTGD